MPRPSRWPDLLRGAGEEFRERGYDNATLESIGARVGILKGSVYNYVDSKEELLLAVVEQPARALLAELDRLRADTGNSVAIRLRELVRIQVRIFANMDHQYIAAIESLLAEGVRNGEFSLAGEPGVAARAIVGMLDWMQHWFTPRGEQADSQLADQIFALALGGLLAAGGIHSLAKGTSYAAQPVPPTKR